MKPLFVLLALALAACANISPTVGPVSSTVNIGTPKPPVPIVTTVIERCAPPPELLEKFPPLPPITAERLSPQDLLDIALSHIGQYVDNARAHAALVDWINQKCAGTSVVAPDPGEDNPAPTAHDIH